MHAEVQATMCSVKWTLLAGGWNDIIIPMENGTIFNHYSAS
jgi:hypothetical protein